MAREHTLHRERHAWTHTAAMLAMIHNANCSKRSDLKSAKDFYPKGLDQDEPGGKAAGQDEPVTVPFAAMKQLFGAKVKPRPKSRSGSPCR